MFAYEIHQLRSAELRHRADQERLVREALRGRRAARDRVGQQAPEPETHTHGPRRHGFTRAA
ncbi:hypothetical protein ACH4UM_25100 [Streptomyces sp. NPDC020801]|uniref:hypothetical protein n=1 Tax=unclassified Streptomyces TaxID=2593676 RepID=UPI0037B8A7A1